MAHTIDEVKIKKGSKGQDWYSSPLSLTSQFYFCPVPLRLDTFSGCAHACFPGDSKISKYSEELKKIIQEDISKLEVGDKVSSYNFEKKKLVKNKVVYIHKEFAKELLIIKTKSGKTIKATSNHPIFTSEGWKEAGSLIKGDKLAFVERKKPLTKAHKMACSESKKGNKNPNWVEKIDFLCPVCGKIRKVKITCKIPYVSCSVKCMGKLQSLKMKNNNPMKNPLIAKSVSESKKKRFKEDLEFRKKMFESVFTKGLIKNKPETYFEEHYIQKLNLPFKYVGNKQFWITCGEGNFRNPDFVYNNFKEKKVVIELVGSYWHTLEDVNKKKQDYERVGVKSLFIWDIEKADFNKTNDSIRELLKDEI